MHDRAEDALRVSEERLRVLLETSQALAAPFELHSILQLIVDNAIRVPRDRDRSARRRRRSRSRAEPRNRRYCGEFTAARRLQRPPAKET